MLCLYAACFVYCHAYAVTHACAVHWASTGPRRGGRVRRRRAIPGSEVSTTRGKSRGLMPVGREDGLVGRPETGAQQRAGDHGEDGDDGQRGERRAPHDEGGEPAPRRCRRPAVGEGPRQLPGVNSLSLCALTNGPTLGRNGGGFRLEAYVWGFTQNFLPGNLWLPDECA